MDRALLEQLDTINNTLTTQWNRLQNIRTTVDSTGDQAGRAQTRVQDAKSLIERAQRELDKARDAVSKVVSEPAVVMATLCGAGLTERLACRTSGPRAAWETPTT